MENMIGRFACYEMSLGFDSINEKTKTIIVNCEIIDRLENNEGLFYLVKITDEDYKKINKRFNKIKLIEAKDLIDIFDKKQ